APSAASLPAAPAQTARSASVAAAQPVAGAGGRPRMGSAADFAPTARRARSFPDIPPLPDVAAARQPSSPDQEVDPSAVESIDTDGPPSEPGGARPFIQSLPEEVQEQLYGTLCDALDASLAPALEKQKELEARVALLLQSGQSAAANASARVPSAATLAQPARAPSLAPKASLPPKTSLVPTSYGYVLASEGAVPRPALDVALEKVGPIDNLPDFGRNRRIVGRILVALLLAGLLAVITATVLSHV
ncbi:MAG TPA: hypothetical protein VM580_13675, partial [Labilithrix sp.]|nr:hypothetical protein [Labilithrix sp.]